MKKINFIFLVGIMISLTSCGTESVKREGIAPPVSTKFDLKGHLTPEPQINPDTTISLAPIPDLVRTQAIIINPNTHVAKKRYSVSAINVPVSELLYTLSVDAKKELDLDSSLKANVTINAVNQTLESILQRIAEQAGATYQVFNNVISVKKDNPYWHTYRIDYVNISKEIKDTMVLKMAVGTGVGAGLSQSSSFETSSTAKHDIWESLINSVKEIVATKEQKAEGFIVSRTTRETLGARNNNNTKNSALSQERGLKIQRGGRSNSENQSNHTTTKVKQSSNVVLNREAGLLTVYTTRAKHFTVTKYINTVVSRISKQVLIEATVIEVELNDKYQSGVDWTATNSTASGSQSASQQLLGTNLSTNPAFSLNLSSLGSFNFNLGIKMLQQFGDAKVLSSPKIMALNNQSALLKVVNNEVYFTVDVDRESATATSAGTVTYTTKVNTVPVGFMMNMTPFLSDSDDITIKIRPTLSRIIGYVNDPNPVLAQESIVSRVPIIQEREMDSILRLKNKQTAILGGLIQDKHDNQRSGVPGLSAIPFIGDLFSYRSDEVKKSELIIFIRPIIVKNPDIANGDLKRVKHFLNTRSM